MPWARIAADLIVVIHACFVAFVVLGLLAIVVGLILRWAWVRNFWFRTLHLAAIGVVAFEAVIGMNCPLTVLENNLRQQAGQVTYPGAFIGYWAHRLIFIEGEPWMFTVAYTLFGLAVAGAYLVGPPHWPWRKTSRTDQGQA